MPKGIYERTDEHKKKISEARRRYFDEHGRVVPVSEKDNKTEYMRLYQRQWRKNHPHNYRDKARVKRKSLKESINQQ